MNKSVNNIINALGGTTKLANLLGVNPSAVSNYRQKGRHFGGLFLLKNY